MLLVPIIVAALWGVAVSYPHDDSVSYSFDPISEEDREFLASLPSHRLTYPAGFKQTWLARNGTLFTGAQPTEGLYIPLIGSPLTSMAALQQAAEDIHNMLKYAPSEIFSNVVNNHSGLALFHRPEKITIYPQYSHLKDTPECRGKCYGSCRSTCTFDGRKWETLGGLSGSIALVLQENVMCVHDPLKSRNNIAVYEFARAVDSAGMTSEMMQMKNDAYYKAKANRTWRRFAYSMTNAAEYWGMASGSFFNVERQTSSGGMNECYGWYRYCRTEQEARTHIEHVDPKLYELLSWVYTDRRPHLSSGLTVCPSNAPVG